jgi:hypothetical protein
MAGGAFGVVRLTDIEADALTSAVGRRLRRGRHAAPDFSRLGCGCGQAQSAKRHHSAGEDLGPLRRFRHYRRCVTEAFSLR